MRQRPATPVMKRPVVDRLAFLLPITLDRLADQRKPFEDIRLRIENEIDSGNCERAFIGHGRYYLSFHIRLSVDTRVLVQVGARDPKRQKGDILVDMNPAKFQPGDVALFHEVMRRIVGDEYDDWLRYALLHRVDFAVDVIHADLSRMLVRYNNAQRSTTFGKRVADGGRVETYNFGSETSSYMTTVYSKNIEQVHQAALRLAKEGRGTESLKMNAIRQLKRVKGLPPTTRVEVRCVELRNMPLWELESETNRFARFSFAYLGESEGTIDQWLEEAFLSLCRDRGVKAALATFKNSGFARQINAFWKSRQCVWWKPELLWEQSCHALRESGIFPVQAFTYHDPADCQAEELLSLQSLDIPDSSPRHRPAAVTFKRVSVSNPANRQGVSHPSRTHLSERL